MQKSYFGKSFVIIVLSCIFFVGLKAFLPKRIFPDTPVIDNFIVVDSLMLEALTGKNIDTVLQQNATNVVINIPSSKSVSAHLEYYSEKETVIEHKEQLNAFYEKLYQLEQTQKGQIRIGYFGDSMTDGDYIVQDLRKLLQENFGGQGVGFVSITSESAASRVSIKHNYSNNWNTQSFVRVKKPLKPFGVSGQVFFVKNNKPTWVEYKASYQNSINHIYNPTLFYGHSNNKDAYVEITYNGDTTRVRKNLHPDKILNTISLADKDIKSMRLNFVNADSIAFYGINSAGKQGILVDNFSSRGNSGLPLSMFNTSLMQSFDKELGNYDLIVLHFGANVLNYGSLNYSWYEKGMTKVVDQIKRCFPKASILIVSTADKSTKYQMKMRTDSAVLPLTRAQAKYAAENSCGFINLYELMGGRDSMVEWVEAEPSLATKDYTHFNAKGSKKIAELLYNRIINDYNNYKARINMISNNNHH